MRQVTFLSPRTLLTRAFLATTGPGREDKVRHFHQPTLRRHRTLPHQHGRGNGADPYREDAQPV